MKQNLNGTTSSMSIYSYLITWRSNQSDVATLTTKLFFKDTVAKAYNPDLKFDFNFDLIGDYGTGKMAFLKKLARDSIENFKGRDKYIKMQLALDGIYLVKSRSFVNKIKYVMDSKQGWEKTRRHNENGWKRYI